MSCKADRLAGVPLSLAVRSFKWLFVLAIINVSLAVSSMAYAQDDPVSSCFNRLADAGLPAKEGFSHNLADMRRAKSCEKVAARVMKQCLAAYDANEDAVPDLYHCIGKVANPCMDSRWGAIEMRKLICIGAEERFWIDMVHLKLGLLKSMGGEKFKSRLKKMERAFFTFRHNKCNSMRAVFKGYEPYVAYGACTTETAARLAIDLREMYAQAKIRFKTKASGANASEKSTADYLRSAERLLSAFVKSDADHRALTASLRPTPKDYAAAYKEPFASRLAQTNKRLWDGRALVRPNPGQTEVKVTIATSDELLAGDAVLKAFPGGYKRVTSKIKAGVPIAVFRFVEPGQSAGLRFDGLVFVNNRWVLMPKPWRALD